MRSRQVGDDAIDELARTVAQLSREVQDLKAPMLTRNNAPRKRVVLISPNGSLWQVTINNTGTIQTSAL